MSAAARVARGSNVRVCLLPATCHLNVRRIARDAQLLPGSRHGPVVASASRSMTSFVMRQRYFWSPAHLTLGLVGVFARPVLAPEPDS